MRKGLAFAGLCRSEAYGGAEGHRTIARRFSEGRPSHGVMSDGCVSLTAVASDGRPDAVGSRLRPAGVVNEAGLSSVTVG